MKHCVVLIIVLLQLSTGSSTECPDCGTDAITCVYESGTVESCIQNCGENDQVFRLSSEETASYVYEGTDVILKVKLEDTTNSTDVTVTVSFGGISNTTTAGSDQTYLFNVSKVTKSSEGEYIFNAVGKLDDVDLCSTIVIPINYVFTIGVQLQMEHYVLTKGVTEIIPVTITSEAGDWTRINLYENSPFAENNILELHAATDSPDTVYSYHIATPKKHEAEGKYNFSATEHSSTDKDKTHTEDAIVTVYVHSTLLEASRTLYLSNIGDNVNISLDLSTDLQTWDNITVDVIRPDGTLAIIEFHKTFPKSDSHLVFTIYNVKTDDFGIYTFQAMEHTGTSEFGVTSFALNVSLHGEIVIFSDLDQRNDSYFALTEQENVIYCWEASEQNVSWWAGDVQVANNETLGAIYQGKEDKNRTLHLKANVDYSDSGNFTCKSTRGEKVISVVIEGLSDATLSHDHDTFTCTVRGNPRPSIFWNIGGDDVDTSFFANPIREDLDAYITQSKITVLTSTLCLGNQKITCNASNPRGSGNQQQYINKGYVGMYRNQYLVLSDVKLNRSDAANSCDLIIVNDTQKEKLVTDLSIESKINDFYVGAILEGGAWYWPDGSEVSNLQLPTDGVKCAKYTKNLESWAPEAVDCSNQLNYACEIAEQDDYTPKNLNLAIVECDGTMLDASWSAPDSISQKITLQALNSKREILTPKTDILMPNTNKKSYEGLLPETEYSVKVYAEREHCALYPYVESSAITGVGPPKAPNSAQMKQVNDSLCIVTWTYDENVDSVERFWVEVTASVTVDPDSDFPVMISANESSADNRKAHFPLFPNTEYGVKVYAESCAGNSTTFTPSGVCKTPIAAPPNVASPLWLSEDSDIFKITIPAADNRAGPISCQFLVVRYVGSSDVKQEKITESQFSEIKQADSGPVNIGEEYFVYATTPLSTSLTVSLGNELQKSFCVPLTAARRKRAVSVGQNFTAWNRVINQDTALVYYMVTTTPDEDSSKIYIANSAFSSKHIIEARASSQSPNASVIILSILATVIVIFVLGFSYYRWRSTARKSSGRSFQFSYKADSSYDAL